MKIFIDPGHNDKKFDTGAEGNGLREQDITYSISQLVKKELEKYTCEIKLSRENKEDILGSDVNSSLRVRTDMANNWKANLFVSIHCNSHPNTTANGTEVYVYSTSSQVYELAKDICKNISKNINTYDRGVMTANFAVLKNTTMPAMLIECAFLSNVNDANKLKSEQVKIANAIVEKIVTYYNLQKKNQEIENIDEIINCLQNEGILTDVEHWKKKLNEDTSSYWLARKMANYINSK